MIHSNFWCYSLPQGWHDKKKPGLHSPDALHDYIIELGYDDHPHLLLGDELNYIAVYEEPERDYLFHMEIGDIKKIFFATDFPSMMKIVGEFQKVIADYYKTVQLLENMKDD